MATEYRLDTGLARSLAIDYLGDRDSFQTTFINGLTYSVRVSGAYSGGGTLADPNLTLQDSAGNTLRFNDDIVQGVNRDAQLTFKVGQTADYTLVVGEQGNNATGSYTLRISAGYATNANDTVGGTAYGDAINGMDGADYLNGGGGNDLLYGGLGNDHLFGGIGNDLVQGDAGADKLRGWDGNDRLYGGAGADSLYGGLGADTFVFSSAGDSAPGGIDVIRAGDNALAFEGAGVAGGDLIDLRGIDANEYLSGNQAFVWSTARTAGTAYLADVNGNTVLYGHTDNDRVYDFALVIADGTLTAARYGVGDFLL